MGIQPGKLGAARASECCGTRSRRVTAIGATDTVSAAATIRTTTVSVAAVSVAAGVVGC